MPDYTEEDIERVALCPVTHMYCTGDFCDDYGCAKQSGFWDREEDDF